MTVMVTGGKGFLGGTLVKLLSDLGNKVVNYDRSNSPEGNGFENIINVQGDLNDLPKLIETVREHEVTKIIHTAAISHPYFSRDIPYQTVVTNALGTTNVLETARLCGVKRVVNLSSECAYGNNQFLEKVTEDSPLDPTTPYGATKVFTEKLGNVYSELYNVEVPSLRMGWIYGPGQFMQCYMKTLLKNAIDGVPTYEKEGEDYRFQYVHVEDAARACILAADVEFERHPGVYNITGGIQITYKELVDRVKKLFPNAKVEIGSGSIEVLDDYGFFDISKAERELGYTPQFTLETGMETYSEWLKKYPF